MTNAIVFFSEQPQDNDLGDLFTLYGCPDNKATKLDTSHDNFSSAAVIPAVKQAVTTLKPKPTESPVHSPYNPFAKFRHTPKLSQFSKDQSTITQKMENIKSEKDDIREQDFSTASAEEPTNENLAETCAMTPVYSCKQDMTNKSPMKGSLTKIPSRAEKSSSFNSLISSLNPNRKVILKSRCGLFVFII